MISYVMAVGALSDSSSCGLQTHLFEETSASLLPSALGAPLVAVFHAVNLKRTRTRALRYRRGEIFKDSPRRLRDVTFYAHIIDVHRSAMDVTLRHLRLSDRPRLRCLGLM